MDNLEQEDFIRTTSPEEKEKKQKEKKKKKIKLIHWLVLIFVLLCILVGLMVLVLLENRDENKVVPTKVEEYTLGIKGETITSDIVEISNKDMPDGVYVLSIDENSLAYRAGVMKGDIITEVAGADVTEEDDVDNALLGEKEGKKIKITVMRQSKDDYTKVVLSAKLKKTDV